MVRRKFTDKNSVKFKLVHRPVSDPLADDPDEPQLVLAPIARNHGTSAKDIRKQKEEAERMSRVIDKMDMTLFGIHDGLEDHTRQKMESNLAEVRLVPEQRCQVLENTEDCYFPLDGYNYEKHLKPMGQAGAQFIPADAKKPETWRQDTQRQ
eukprot:Platyproteum_vivax@DN6069_c1_g1_i1.p1